MPRSRNSKVRRDLKNQRGHSGVLRRKLLGPSWLSLKFKLYRGNTTQPLQCREFDLSGAQPKLRRSYTFDLSDKGFVNECLYNRELSFADFCNELRPFTVSLRPCKNISVILQSTLPTWYHRGYLRLLADCCFKPLWTSFETLRNSTLPLCGRLRRNARLRINGLLSRYFTIFFSQ